MRSTLDQPSLPRDVFAQIAVRLTNSDLEKLLCPELWPAIRELLSESRFWYERCVWIYGNLPVKTDISWPRVYRTLEATLTSESKSWRHLDCLYSVSLLESIFCPTHLDPDDDQDLWNEIEHPTVLEYMLYRYLEPSMDGFLLCLKSMSQRGVIVMIEPLLSHISDEFDENEDIERHDVMEAVFGYVLESAEHGHLPIVQLLLAYLEEESFEHEDEKVSVLAAAISSGDEDMLQFALDLAKGMSPITVHEIAIDQDSTVLLERERSLSASQTRKLFKHAMKVEAVQCMQLLLERDSQLGMGVQALITAAKQGALPVLLDDPRTDVMSHITAILEAYPRAGPVLAAHPRVKVEKLTDRAFELLMESLLSHIWTKEALRDKVRGFALGGARPMHAWEVAHVAGLSRTLLRLILAKMPSSVELMDWLIATGDERARKASVSVLRGEIDAEGDVPVQALLLCMLYPDLKLSELLAILERAGVDYETCILSGQLVGAHLGETELRARAVRSQGQTRA